VIQMENRKKDKMIHGIIFILVIIFGILLTVSVNIDQRENKIKLAILEARLENAETWIDEVEKNGINLR